MHEFDGKRDDESGQNADENPPSDPDDPRGVDMWVMPYLRDSTLWPVLFVMAAAVVAFVAPVMVYAFRDRQLRSFPALGVLAFLTFKIIRWEIRERESFGAISRLIVILWGAAAIAAYLAGQRGFL